MEIIKIINKDNTIKCGVGAIITNGNVKGRVLSNKVEMRVLYNGMDGWGEYQEIELEVLERKIKINEPKPFSF